MTKRMLGVNEFGPIICKALGLDPKKTARVIIDVDATMSGPVKVYVEMYTDEQVLTLDWAEGLAGAAICREPRDE